MSNSTRRLQHFPQGLFYNIDHWYTYSRYDELLKNADLVTQRDYVYDRSCYYTNLKEGGTPTLPFVQCGLEPLGILGATVNEMLLQSHNVIIRVFPAVPSDWPAAFTLRAVGGFLVSSAKQPNSSPHSVRIQSLLGNECCLVNPWPAKKVIVEVSGSEKPSIEINPGQKVIVFKTKRGLDYTIRPSDESGPQVFNVPSGTQNRKPKYFKEAILGKPRDF